MTATQRRLLRDAAAREDGNVCPTYGLRGAAQSAAIASLARLGFVRRVTKPYILTHITEEGRIAIGMPTVHVFAEVVSVHELPDGTRAEVITLSNKRAPCCAASDDPSWDGRCRAPKR